MSNSFIRLFATFFYMGYFPIASGTFASVLGMGLAYLVRDNPFGYSFCLAVLVGVGFLTSGKMEKNEGHRDPSCVVIDEVAGALVAFFLLPFRWPVILTTFFLYRALDMFKICGIAKIEKRAGSLGIMGDDLLAGLYTNVIMQVALRLAGYY